MPQAHPERPLKPKPKQKACNPIEEAITAWLAEELPTRTGPVEPAELLARAPKRWTVYEPMILLPSGAFSSPPWSTLLSAANGGQLEKLWAGIVAAISKRSGSKLTHLAVNEGIPLLRSAQEDQRPETSGPEHPDHEHERRSENILRSPSGLRTLYGDFGPASALSPSSEVAEQDFARAFWVATRQNGIQQTWAPRWTMFSRGNIKEKARLLAFHEASDQPAHPHRVVHLKGLQGKWAVDLYAGIGYFVFSYARLGLRVLCWELNPWSVEGLRRGALANGWSVRVVRGAELRGELDMNQILRGGERIVVFQEDNAEALGRLQQVHGFGLDDQQGGDHSGSSADALEIVHVNCGFLPTSEPCWENAWEMARRSTQSWLHLHENVGVAGIEQRKSELQALFDGLSQMSHGSPGAGKRLQVEHVELVKTYAPGVWHCVFDIHVADL